MPYLLFKLLHVAAVVLFLGNITTGVFWIHHAMRSRSPARLAETMDGVIRSDRLFTLPSVVFIILSGGAAAYIGGFALLRTGWIAWGIGLFALSGLVFAALSPLQRRIRDHAARPDVDWPGCERLVRRWDLVGALSLLPAWTALALMVLKLPH